MKTKKTKSAPKPVAVFVLTIATEGLEGDPEVLGVYASRLLAKAAAKSHAEKRHAAEEAEYDDGEVAKMLLTWQRWGTSSVGQRVDDVYEITRTKFYA